MLLAAVPTLPQFSRDLCCVCVPHKDYHAFEQLEIVIAIGLRGPCAASQACDGFEQLTPGPCINWVMDQLV